MTPDSLIAALRARECADEHHEDAATFLPRADLIADAREARRAAQEADGGLATPGDSRETVNSRLPTTPCTGKGQS